MKSERGPLKEERDWLIEKKKLKYSLKKAFCYIMGGVIVSGEVVGYYCNLEERTQNKRGAFEST